MKDLKKIVVKILEDYPETRSNDNLLIAMVIERKFCVINTYVVNEITKSNIYESIGRLRRMVQRENPMLCAEEKVQNSRRKKEQEVREFVRGL